MFDQRTLEEITQQLVKTYNPLEVYLFGSHAWGQPTKDSDLDLFVVIKSSKKNKRQRVIAGYEALSNFDVPNDLIVYTKEEFEKHLKHPSTLSSKIFKHGKKLYAKMMLILHLKAPARYSLSL